MEEGIRMKFLILNGAEENHKTVNSICNIFFEVCEFNGHEVDLINLRDLEIADCRGEFNCWIKTPGVCMIADEGYKILELISKSHNVIMVTPINYGGYTYHLKKALDRFIPFLSPLFMMRSGEVHHRKRYAQHPNFITVGTMPEADIEKEQIFKKLIRRSSLYLDGPLNLGSVIFDNQPQDSIRKEAARLLKEVGV